MKNSRTFRAAGILAFLPAFFFCAALRAQPLYAFPQPGLKQTEIYHGDWTTGFQPFNRSFIYQSDTTVNSFTYSKFSYIPVGSSNPWYTYYSNGKVYWQGNSPLTNPMNGVLLYDFALNLGDSINLQSYLHFGFHTVDSVSTILLANGQTRKYMRLRNGTSVVTWIDAIGDIENGFFYSADFEGGYEEFVCHEDSTGAVYSKPNTTFACDVNDPVVSSGTFSCGPFTYSVQITGDICNCTGSISITNLSGGTGAYTLQWSNGQNGFTLNSACTGNYSVTITDMNGNTCSASFYVPQTALNVTTSVTQDSCTGWGSACVNVTGGSAPYAYAWSPTGHTTPCISNMPPGTYSVCVTDANGCTQCIAVTIPNYNPLSVTITPTQPSCPGCCNGDIQVTPGGGTPPYMIFMTPPPPQFPGTYCEGPYTICVTDSVGCTICDSIALLYPTSVADPGMIASWSLYPNPAKDILRISDKNAVGERAQIFDARGALLRTVRVSGEETLLDVSGLSAGIYLLKYKGAQRRFAVGR